MVELFQILGVAVGPGWIGGCMGKAMHCCAWKLKMGLQSPVGLSSAPHCRGICVRLVEHFCSYFLKTFNLTAKEKYHCLLV